MTVVAQTLDVDGSLWDAWTPREVAEVLDGVEAPWCVAAGWAIDLFLGEQRREHDDLEIVVPNDRFAEVAEALSAFEIFVITGPGVGMRLEGAQNRLDDTHQTWVRVPETGRWLLDVMREPSDGETWVYRRDPRVRMPYDQVIERTPDGIPYCRPEVVVLFKAKEARPKDQGDLEAVLPSLGSAGRRWLVEALEIAHPGHPWIARVAGTGA
ncbi:MAG TPA: hypothetical protein VMK83_00300 [Gaiellaceae bacterium]|nr:hypothetical protein [Gaiellaceae bacterium]